MKEAMCDAAGGHVGEAARLDASRAAVVPEFQHPMSLLHAQTVHTLQQCSVSLFSTAPATDRKIARHGNYG